MIRKSAGVLFLSFLLVIALAALFHPADTGAAPERTVTTTVETDKAKYGFLPNAITQGPSRRFCHHLPDRTPHVDNEYCVFCYRCSAIYSCFLLGLVLYFGALGRRLPPSWVLGAALAPIVLIVLDTQVFPSTNMRRMITGGLFGLSMSTLLPAAWVHGLSAVKPARASKRRLAVFSIGLAVVFAPVVRLLSDPSVFLIRVFDILSVIGFYLYSISLGITACLVLSYVVPGIRRWPLCVGLGVGVTVVYFGVVMFFGGASS